jgi:DNA-binding transcriptional MerR regulator/quercetin dioxygenase-like cupin family protein
MEGELTSSQDLAARHYKVGEVAELVGVSPQTLRVWEQKGLLVPKRTNGRHRLYSDDDVARANQVAMMRRRHGWNPAAIKSSLSLRRSREAGSELSLGMRLRAARRSRGLTLSEAAERVNVFRGLLSSVERGEVAISSQLIAQLANLYRMPTSAFVVAAPDPTTTIVRAAERPRTVMEGGVTWEELVSPGHALEPALLIVPAGGTSGGAYSRPGEVFVHLTSGSMSFSVDDEGEVELKEGDSIILIPPSTWSWRNSGKREARAIYVEQLPAEAWS